MVYRGKPSRGCERCRKVHKKCDERRPECSRCLKMRKPCPGYRDQTDLLFHDETFKTQQKLRQQHMARKDIKLDILAHNSSSLMSTTEFPLVHAISQDSIFSMSSSLEDFAIYHFYHTSMDNLSHADPVRHLQTLLPTLYLNSHTGSALRMATEAVAYIASSKLVPEATQLARTRYVQAIKKINKAIQDPIEVGSDETLYAILLLCGYETMVWGSNEAPKWGTHIDGAVAVVKLRRENILHRPVSPSFFSFIRKSVVLSHMQQALPVDEVFTEPNEASFPHENPEDQLMSHSAQIPKLQHWGITLLSDSKPASKSDLGKFISQAMLLDCELSDWAGKTAVTWPYSTATNVNAPSGPGFQLQEVHKYLDFYTARVWNFYRVSRLIVQSLLLRATSHWLQTYPEKLPENVGTSKFEATSLKLVHDVCASVPFLLGHDLSRMKAPTPKCQWIQDNHEYERLNDGRFSLIWPLYVACSSPSVPEALREWLRMQLQLIGEHGESRADFVRLTESQTLLGRAEKFRFDCV